jgi:hypothetical protein
MARVAATVKLPARTLGIAMAVALAAPSTALATARDHVEQQARSIVSH